MSRPASVHGSTKQSTNGTSRSRGMPGHVTKTSVSVPIKLSKEYQSKIFNVLGAKNKQSLSGNEIELFSAENPGADNKVLLDALRAFTDRRITKCSFVFPEKVCNAFTLRDAPDWVFFHCSRINKQNAIIMQLSFRSKRNINQAKNPIDHIHVIHKNRLLMFPMRVAPKFPIVITLL